MVYYLNILIEKLRVTEASKYNESHSRGYRRKERKGIRLAVSTSMLHGDKEAKHRKPKAARSIKELMYEAAMMDRDAIGTVGFDSRERAKLWLEHGLNSFRNKVCAEESQVFWYESRDAESYNQEAPVDVSHEIEGSRACTVFNSIKDNLEKANRQLCSLSRAILENGDAPDIGV